MHFCASGFIMESLKKHMSYYAKARWIDENNRSHNWNGEVSSSDRNQIKSQIRSQTGAKDVIISSVTSRD